MLLPIIGAGLGGYEGYRRSGGNIGATLLAAGLGAVTPGGLRMAGTALGAKLAGSGLASQAGAGLMSGAARLGKVAAKAPGTLQAGLAESGAAQLAKGARILSSPGLSSRLLPGMVGNLAVGTGMTLGAPALAGALASNVAPAAGTAAAGAAGLMYPGGGAGPAQYGGDALPPGMGQFGPTDPYGTTFEILNPAGVAAGRRAEYGKTIEQQRDAMRTLLPEIFQASEARSKAELQRQLAAAGVRQNIITAANMLERSQQAAQQMGLNAASQAGSALTSQYQYQ
jgi:hypothetical protein